MLPNDLPNWKTFHHYFLTWSKAEIFDIDTTGFPPNAHFILINTANTSERKMCKTGFEEVQKDGKKLLKNIQKTFAMAVMTAKNFWK